MNLNNKSGETQEHRQGESDGGISAACQASLHFPVFSRARLTFHTQTTAHPESHDQEGMPIRVSAADTQHVTESCRVTGGAKTSPCQRQPPSTVREPKGSSLAQQNYNHVTNMNALQHVRLTSVCRKLHNRKSIVNQLKLNLRSLGLSVRGDPNIEQ